MQKSTTSLQQGLVYSGVVIAADLTTRTLAVSVEGVEITGCIYAAGSMALFFGVEEVGLPQPGTYVLVAYMSDRASVVLGAIGNIPDTTAKRPVISGIEDELKPGDEKAFKVKQPSTMVFKRGLASSIDLLPGESERVTGTGPALRLLYNFAQLSASDAAKVEAHVFNDMVRICDNYFAHHMCGGDEFVWSAGKNTKEFHFTGWPHEAEGKIGVNDPLAHEAGGTLMYDPADDVDNPYSDTGRWRLSEYYGFLGDMVHRWVTTPTEVISNIMEGAFRAGQYRSWVGSDGTLCVQAGGGVQIEVTQHIVIPAILKAWNQPDFDMAQAMESLDTEFLKVWGKGPNWEDVSVACWQLQYYSRYISLWHSLARMRQLQEKEYCKIPTEKDSPERIPTAGEPDKTFAYPEAAMPMGGHSILSMDPSGSVALVSNGKNSMILNQGNMQFSCEGNIEIKAGGTIHLQAKDMSIQAANRLEIVSLFGELAAKARTSLRMLCEAGVLWLKGDAKKDKNADTDAYKGETKPEKQMAEFAVVIDASEGKTLVHGAEAVVVASSGEKGKVNLQADGSESEVNITAQKQINLLSTAGSVCMRVMNFLCRATQTGFTAQVIKLGASVMIQEGALHASMIKSRITAAVSSFFGQTMFVNKLEKDQKIQYTPKLYNESLNVELGKLDALLESKVEIDYNSTEFVRLTFELPKWESATVPSADKPAALKASPFEVLALSNATDEPSYFTLPIQQARLMNARRTSSTNLPYPGEGAVMFKCQFDKQKPLAEAWEQDFTASDIKKVSDLTPVAYTYCFT